MGILRKLKKLVSIQIPLEEVRPPPPNGRHRRRDQPAPSNIAYNQLPRSFFNAVNSAREEAGYDPLPVRRRGSIPAAMENFRDQIFRSNSREQSFDRSVRDGSPQHFHHDPPGTPVKYRRRPVSPDFLQQHASSPFLFRQSSLPGSPDLFRRFQHAQELEHMAMLQQQQQQQQQQQGMMMGHYPPQFQQQPFHPMMNRNVNMHPWLMMPQPQMYPFY